MGILMITGWKTLTGAGLVAAGAVLRYLDLPDAADAVTTIGAALGIIGIGHKVEKAKK